MAAGGSAEIGIRVFLDDAASSGLSAINSNLASIGRAASAASKSFGDLSGSMAALGVLTGFGVAALVFGAAIKYAVDQADAFQQSMFSVAVATHVPMDAAMQYSNTLMNLAASSTYTSSSIADGIVQMGRAGFSIHDIFTQMSQAGAGFVSVGGRMVPIMSSMAEAGIALGIATRSTAVQGFTLLTQSMAAYRAPADQALHYANLLQFAFEHQRGSVADLTSGLSQVTPVAAQMGVPLREVVAALDVMGPAMKSTAVAGTALRYMISAMYQPTAGQQKEMVALGLATVDAGGKFHSSFYDAQGRAIDFDTAVHTLADHLKGLTDEQRMAALKNLFSVRGGQGADILLSQVSKLDAYLRQLQQSSDNAGGAMRRWEEVMRTFGGAMAGLRSSVADLGVAIGTALLPMLTNIATRANQVISSIRAMAMANPQAAASFLRLGLAMSLLGVVATLVIMAIAGVGTGIMLFVAIVLGVAAATVGATVGIMLLANWFRSLNISAASVRTALAAVAIAALAVSGVFAGIKVASLVLSFASMVPALAALIVEFGLFVVEGALYAASVAADVVASLALRAALIGALLPAILDVTIAWLLEAAAMLIANAPFILLIAIIAAMVVGLGLLIVHLAQTGQLLAMWRAVWAAIAPVVSMVTDIIRGALISALQQLIPVWNQLVQAFNQARPALMMLGAVLGGVILTVIVLVIAILAAFVVALATVIATVIHVAAGIIQAFMGVVQFFLGFYAVLHGLITHNNAEITAGFSQMGQGILNIIRGLWSAVAAIFIGAYNLVVGIVMTFVNVIVSLFHSLSSILVGRSIIPDMMNAILNVITSGFSAVVSFIVGIIARIVAAFVDMGARVVAAATAAWAAFRNAVSSALSAAVAFVANGAATMVSRVVALGSQIISSANNAWNGFKNAVSSGINTAVSFVQSGVQRIIGAVSGLPGQLYSWGAKAMQSFASGLQSALGAVVNAVATAAGRVADFLSHASPAKMGPLAHDDEWMPNMMRMFASGIESSSPLVTGAVNRMASGIASVPQTIRSATPPPTTATAGGGGAGGSKVVQLVVDGHILGQAVMSDWTTQLQLNGGGRAFR